MKALVYVIALLAIAAAAYFSSSNKAILEEQQQARIDLENDYKKISATTDLSQKEFNTANENLKTARSEQAEINANHLQSAAESEVSPTMQPASRSGT